MVVGRVPPLVMRRIAFYYVPAGWVASRILCHASHAVWAMDAQDIACAVAVIATLFQVLAHFWCRMVDALQQERAEKLEARKVQASTEHVLSQFFWEDAKQTGSAEARPHLEIVQGDIGTGTPPPISAASQASYRWPRSTSR